MSRASIFDLLHQRQRPVEPVGEVSTARSDYDTQRLRLLDGVALTPSGVVAAGTLPEAQPPVLSSSLYGADGFRRFVYRIADVMPAQESRLGRIEARALRLHRLIQTLAVDALMLLEALPDETAFDVVVSAPTRSDEAAQIIIERLRAAIAETQHGQWLNRIDHGVAGAGPHASLAVGAEGGMAHVLWISADSLLDDEGVAALQRRSSSSRASGGAGLHPGETAVALLLQRLLPDEMAFDGGWLIDSGVSVEHLPRSTSRDHVRRRTLLDVLAQGWPPSANDAQPQERAPEESDAPTRLVIDTLSLPGRAVEAGGALIERWPELDLVTDGVSVDGMAGWPGEAVTALAWALALASLQPGEHALVLSLEAESATRVWRLMACTARVAGEEAHS